MLGTWMSMEPSELPPAAVQTSPTSWTCPVDENGILTLPDELWELMGWKVDDELEWVDQENGSFLLKKVDETL